MRKSWVLMLPAVGGMAALSWEVIWQLRTSLAFGVSATGAAITLATMMAGMTLGASVGGRRLERGDLQRPLRMYALLELAIGVCGLLLGSTFSLLEQMDGALFQMSASLAPLAHLLGVVAVIFLPAVCMGASIPVFGRISEEHDVPVSLLYGLNTLGAAAGTLLVAFLLIPLLGLQGTAWVAALLNLLVAAVAWTLPGLEAESAEPPVRTGAMPGFDVLTVVFATGLVTFMLEVAWFRALRAAFETTTTGFAIMLAVVLLALGLSARFVPMLRARAVGLEVYILAAGISILVSTPLIERLDLLLATSGSHNSPIGWFSLSFLLVGPSVFLLGVALPWYLESGFSPDGMGRIYAVNTIGAVLGALGSAWLLLPTLGFVQTAWLAGVLLLVVAFAVSPSVRGLPAGLAAVGAVAVAVLGQSGIGTTRVPFSYAYGAHEVIAYSEGPDASTSVIEMKEGGRGLFIDGFAAAAFWSTTHYMAWMGSLPVVLAEDPENALIICFGTGQTTNAVRKEGLERTTIVDVNPAVFELSRHFPKNESVLDDPKVRPVVMDGRAFLRRTTETFDVITLEPMPPNHAGVNALYSREFYELARARLSPNGVTAQWLPAHLVSTQHAKSVAKTFQDVFPNAVLWVDPSDDNGILLGTPAATPPLGTRWPGLDSPGPERNLDAAGIRAALMLDSEELRAYAADGTVVTDDNQHLAYGADFNMKVSGPRAMAEVHEEFVSHDVQ